MSRCIQPVCLPYTAWLRNQCLVYTARFWLWETPGAASVGRSMGLPCAGPRRIQTVLQYIQMQAKAEPSGQDGSISVRKYPRNEYIYKKGQKIPAREKRREWVTNNRGNIKLRGRAVPWQNRYSLQFLTRVNAALPMTVIGKQFPCLYLFSSFLPPFCPEG